MGFGTAFAANFFGEINNIKRAQAQAIRDKELKDADFENQKELYRFQSNLITERTQKEYDAKADERQRDDYIQLWNSYPDALKMTILGTEEGRTAHEKMTGVPISAEYIQTANALTNADENFAYGPVTFKKPNDRYDISMGSTDQLLVADTWLSNMSSEFADPEKAKDYITRLENAGYLDKFVEDVNRYTDYYVQGQLSRPNVDKELLTSYLEPTFAFGTLYQALKDNNVSLEVEDVETMRLKEKAKKDGEIDDPANSYRFKFVNPNTNETVNDIYEFSDEQMSSISRIASATGYGANVQGFINDFSDVARAETGQEAYSLLLDALEFEKMNVAALNKTAAGTTQLRVNIGNQLKEKYGDDPYPAVQAIAVLMVTEEETKAMANKRKGRKVKLAPADDYFKRNGLDKEQIALQFDASEETLRQLRELERLLLDDRTPTGLKAAAVKVGFGILGTGGQLDQWFGESGNDQNLDEGGDGVPKTTVDSLMQRAIDGGFISPTSAKQLSEIDALKLTLAAQMARAVDPSGRLSNQDFEVQLKRLGQSGLFTSKIQAGASLNVVIGDFERQRRRLLILNEVASAESFGIREARILKADRIVRQSRAAAYAGETSGTGGTKASALKAPPGLTFQAVPITPGLFTATDQDGTIYYSTDQDGTKLIDESAAMDMIDQVMMRGGSST